VGVRVQEEEIVRCLVCKQADTQPGKATVTLERDGTTLVIKGVPARVCPNCGEEYVDEVTASQLLRVGDEVARAGVQVAIREFAVVA